MKYTAIPVAVLAGVAVCSGLKDDYTVTIPESVASWDTDADFGHATSKNWTFLDRFAFGHEARWTFEAEIEGRARVGESDGILGALAGGAGDAFKGFHILAFYDEKWEDVYPENTMNCSDFTKHTPNRFALPSTHDEWSSGSSLKSRLKCSKTAATPGQLSNFEGLDSTGGGAVNTPGVGAAVGSLARVKYTCQGEREFGALAEQQPNGDLKKLDDKYWFFVLSCCNCQPVHVRLSMHLTNGKSNFSKEFSTDESWVFACVIVGLVWSFLVLFLQFHSDNQHTAGSHLTRFLFKTSIVVNIVAFFCYLAYYDKFSNDGKAPKGLLYAGDVIWLIGEVIFVALLFILAKGWTIYRPEIRKASVVKMAVFLFFYFIIYINVLVYENKHYDEGIVTFRYDSGPGYALCAMYAISWGWFSWYIFVTLKPFKDNEMIERITLGRSIVCPENKKFFFKVFWAAYTVWFLMFPIAVAGLINNSEDFVRTNAAWVVWTVRQCLGYMILLVLWWPSHHNKFFPFERSAGAVGMSAKKPRRPTDDQYEDVQGGNIDELDGSERRRSLFASSPDGFKDIESSLKAQKTADDEYESHDTHQDVITPTRHSSSRRSSEADKGALDRQPLPPISNSMASSESNVEQSAV